MELAQVLNLTQPRALTEDLLTKWILSLDAASRTKQSYHGAIKQLLQYFSSIGIEKPEREHLIAWKGRLCSYCTPGSINLYITATRLFFQWLENEHLYSNIASGLKGLKLSKAHKKDSLQANQAEEVIQAATSARDKAILRLMFSDALRCIEITRADREDLLTIGGRNYLNILRKGRSEKELVPLENETYKAILAYLSDKEKTTGALFTGASNNRSSGSRLSTRSISGIVKAAMIKAGYNSPRLTAHSTRHSAATIALDAGASIEQVSQLLGHSNINTTMIYIHQRALMDNPCPALIEAAIARGGQE
jgi:integrase/recombinase XerD